MIKAQVTAKYRQRTAKSAQAHRRAMSVLPGGDTRTTTYFDPYPIYIDRGQGCWLTDLDGCEYLDLLGNYTSLIHGHAHSKVTAAVTEQLSKGTAYATPIEAQTRMAEVLCGRVESLERVRFCNSGTEATMHAIRAAKAFTGRNKLIKMEGGYHGTHDAAEISVAPAIANAGPAHAPHSVCASGGLFEGIVRDVVVAPFNDIDAVSAIIEVCSKDLAAVIVEPVMGSAGILPAQAEFLAFLREATFRSGALLILDEVVTFRLAYGGAQQIYGIRPDLTALGKIIGGGFPAGAFGGRADVMAQYDPRTGNLHQSGTFNGNAVTMVAGLAALELLTPREIQRINSLGDLLRSGLSQIVQRLGLAAQVGGMGSLLQVHLRSGKIQNYRDTEAGSKMAKSILHLALLNRGVFGAPRGEYAISTPVGESDVGCALKAFGEALEEVAPLISTREE